MSSLADTLIYLVSVIFGTVNDISSAVTKLLFFALLIAVFFKGSTKAFPENARAARVISVIVALLAVRGLPEPWLPFVARFMWILIVIALPYLFIDKLLPRFSVLKLVFLASTYFGIYLLMTGSISGFFNDILDYWHYYSLHIILALTAFIAYLILRRAYKNKENFK